MLRWLATNIVTVCIMCGLCCGQQNVPDPATYASFFEQVVRLKSGEPVLLNGQDTGLTLQSVQQTIGLTDDETAILQTLAVACATKSRSFDGAARSGTFELRLQLIGADEPTQVRLRQALKDIEERRYRIVRACVDDLRIQLGEQRFEVVQAYISSRKNSGIFFPPISK
jgi:hypothetical protein